MKKILLIESDQMIMENTSAFLRSAGFEVYASNNINDAIQTAMRVIPEMVISGISSDAIEFDICKTLKANPATSLIRIVYITSNPKYIQFGMQIGADDFLPKPYSYSLILQTIDNNIAGN